MASMETESDSTPSKSSAASRGACFADVDYCHLKSCPPTLHPEKNIVKLFCCFLLLIGIVFATQASFAQETAPAKPKKAVAAKKVQAAKKQLAAQTAPTRANVPYGEHPRQVLDFWQAESDVPTPVLFFIHGGGWMAGDKAKVGNIDAYLKAGISVASINYRYVSQAYDAGIEPPVKAPLHDAARALQFVRSKASDWNLDKTRIGASGGSAGACSSLWLAFHDDMADPESDDPIARESTRLTCAAVNGAQTTLDPKQMKEWIPNSNYGSHAFGIFKVGGKKYTRDFEAFLEQREKISPWIAEYSPYSLVTADDAPVFLAYGAPPALGKDEKAPTHSANFGVKLQERMQEVGVECELSFPGAVDVSHPNIAAYLIDKLKS
jgi:acetyl esterase/lipase